MCHLTLSHLLSRLLLWLLRFGTPLPTGAVCPAAGLLVLPWSRLQSPGLSFVSPSALGTGAGTRGRPGSAGDEQRQDRFEWGVFDKPDVFFGCCQRFARILWAFGKILPLK